MLSWWGNEVRIWHLLTPAQQLLEDPAAPTNLRKNRRLVAKILVRGESSISSAAISEDGTLLAAATASDIKVFQLDLTGEQLQIKKVALETLGEGASKIQISPDKQWISWVEDGSKVMTARVDTENHTVSRPCKLPRLRRQIPKNLLLGGLGSYDRNITQMAFSPDSKMLAVADLAGYMDTWVLRGPEEELSNGTSGKNDDDDANDSSDSESDEDDSNSSEEGPRWVRNPKAALLPKLSAAPVVLSFSPTQQEEDDYGLLVITTLKQLFVFNPRRGSLSEWSRRNTYPKLPEQFRDTRDLVKGVVWQGERVWVYGVSFLFMLDLSRDFDPEKDNLVSKRKSQGTKRKRQANESGAGGRMDKNSHGLGPQKVRIAQGAEGKSWEEVDAMMIDDGKSVASASGVEDNDDYEDEDEYVGELQRLREENREVDGEEEGKKELVEGSKTAKWWHTYQFRPILGIVPVGNGQDDVPVEVALVERPLSGADLPERYFAEGEWERS